MSIRPQPRTHSACSSRDCIRPPFFIAFGVRFNVTLLWATRGEIRRAEEADEQAEYEKGKEWVRADDVLVPGCCDKKQVGWQDILQMRV